MKNTLRNGGVMRALLLLSLFTSFRAEGAIRTWDCGAGPPGNWSDPRNWEGDVGPVAGDTLVFPPGAACLETFLGFPWPTPIFDRIIITGNGYRVDSLTHVRLTGGITANAPYTTNWIDTVVEVHADQTFECSESTSALVFRTIGLQEEGYVLTLNAVGDIYVRPEDGWYGGVLNGIGGLTKNGTGTLYLLDTDPSCYWTTRVNAGTMVVSHDPTSGIYAGPWIVGDDIGGAAADVVVFQSSNTFRGDVTVNSSGFFNLNGFPGMAYRLRLRGGTLSTGTGVLELCSNLVSQASAQTAVINGQVNVRESGLIPTIHVEDGVAHPDLLINASLSSSGTPMLPKTKTGPGTLTLNGANCFENEFLIWEGTVIVANDAALGATNGPTRVSDPAALVVDRANIGLEELEYSSSSPLVAYGPASWAGPITLTAPATITVPSGTFELRGDLAHSGLTKNGAGTLRLDSVPFPWADFVTVNAGTLELNSPIGGVIMGDLTIGDGVGGPESDVVRLLRDNQISVHLLAPVVVNSSGLLDANGHDSSILCIILNGGRVTTGTGLFRLILGVTNHLAASRGIIRGNLELQPPVGSEDPCDFYTAGPAHFPDLWIDAAILGDGHLSKWGPGEMSLTASNSYTGLTTVNEGTLEVDHSWALGATSGGTVVNAPGILAVRNNSHVPAEPLTLNAGGALALRGTMGSNSWGGPITLSNIAIVDVDSPSDWLNLTGGISGPGGLTKTGQGTLIFSGTADNTYAGDTFVHQGTLLLNKTSADAIAHGTLTIGDGLGGAGADVVRLLANYQIAAIPVRVNRSGLLDLNGFSDGIGPLTLDGGGMTTGSTGLLTLGGDVTVLANAEADPYIAGRLSLGTVTRAFDVAASESLVVSGAVLGTPGLTKRGGGDLILSGSNSFAGLTVVQQGVLCAGHRFALGGTNNGTVVSNGAVLLLASDVAITNESLRLNGPGAGIYGAALCALGGTNRWAGPVALDSDSVLRVDGAEARLTIEGAITGSAGLTKTGVGRLELSGSTDNTHAGPTRVNAGLLVFNKSAGRNAISGELIIGDGVGGADADAVRIEGSSQIANSAAVTVHSSGLLDLGGNNEIIGSLAGSGHVELGSAALTCGGNNASTTFSGRLTGSGGDLVKTGSGTLTLSGTNTHTGGTYVNGGTLLINGSQSASRVTVNAGGTLGGSGTVGSINAVGGTISPGGGVGALTCSNVALSAAATFHVDLYGLIAGEGYDQLNVRGTNNLGNAQLQVQLGFAPQEGDTFRILNNDGTEAIVGTFAGLAEGVLFTVNGLPLRISYTGGTGNDVVLTVTNTALRATGAAAVAGGNGNGVLEPNECDSLSLVLTNRATNTVTGIRASLSTSTPGVLITQDRSAYPDLPPGGSGTNLTPFQLSILPSVPCWTDIELLLTVRTAENGTFAIPVVLSTGAALPARRFDQNQSMLIPDNGWTNSSLRATGLTGTVVNVTVSCHITHSNLADLDLYLLAPDGTTVELSTDNGGTGDNYGTSCADAQRTWFEDDAALPIAMGSAPFVGRYRPESALGVFQGQDAAKLNGWWQFRVADDTAGNKGILQCWSLHFDLAACASGPGPCVLCPEHLWVTGTLPGTALVQTGQLRHDGLTSSCAWTKPCPGTADLLARRYEAYTFANAELAACITIRLETPCHTNLFSAAYLGGFDPANVCKNYLADAGVAGPAIYSFSVPANASFVVVVNEVPTNATCTDYTLTVSGGNCRPVLRITRAGNDQVVLDWSAAATGYQLEGSPLLAPADFQPVLPLPVVVGGRNTVTSDVTGPSRFYRLHKP